MKPSLANLLDLIEGIEDFEPKTDSEAYLKRALLEQLDGAREMLKCLSADN